MPMPSLRLVFASLGLISLAACGGQGSVAPSYQQELFNTGASPYARNFDATANETCEAARRALLSQGFMTTMVQPDTVDATKNFQPIAGYARRRVVPCGVHAGRERDQHEHRVRERRAGRLRAQEKRYVGERRA